MFYVIFYHDKIKSLHITDWGEILQLHVPASQYGLRKVSLVISSCRTAKTWRKTIFIYTVFKVLMWGCCEHLDRKNVKFSSILGCITYRAWSIKHLSSKDKIATNSTTACFLHKTYKNRKDSAPVRKIMNWNILSFHVKLLNNYNINIPLL